MIWKAVDNAAHEIYAAHIDMEDTIEELKI